MTQDIIQHHETFDLESLFAGIGSKYTGLDSHDFTNFLHSDGEKHSFMGVADGSDRVKAALESALYSQGAEDIINRASSVIITLIRSSEMTEPITMEEVGYLNEFISRFPAKCDVAWGFAEDNSLGNMIKVNLLVVTSNLSHQK